MEGRNGVLSTWSNNSVHFVEQKRIKMLKHPHSKGVSGWACRVSVGSALPYVSCMFERMATLLINFRLFTLVSRLEFAEQPLKRRNKRYNC